MNIFNISFSLIFFRIGGVDGLIASANLIKRGVSSAGCGEGRHLPLRNRALEVTFRRGENRLANKIPERAGDVDVDVAGFFWTKNQLRFPDFGKYRHV